MRTLIVRSLTASFAVLPIVVFIDGCSTDVEPEPSMAGASTEGSVDTTVILGDAIDVRDMDSGEQREAADADEAVAIVREAFA